MLEKNWSKKKPTKAGKYWFKFDENSPAFIIFWEVDDRYFPDGWWAPATPPPFDGKDNKKEFDPLEELEGSE